MAKLDVHERGFYLYLNGVPWPAEPTGKINTEAREVLVKMNVLQKGGDTTFVTALKKTIEASEGSLIPVKKLVDPDNPCISCELSKAKTFKPKDRRTDLAQFPGQFVHADVTKVKEEGIGQQRWLVVMLDEYSGRIHASSFSYKGDCNRCITDQLKWYRNQTGRQLKRITVDNGIDVNIQELTAFVRSVGADIRTSPTYSPAQNGHSERTVKAMLVRMRTLMIHRNIPLALWAEIAKSVAYLHNVVVSVETGMSPLARWHVALHATPYVHDIGHLRTLGSRCVVRIPDAKLLQLRTSKLQAKGEEGILVGYSGHHLYRVWVKEPYTSLKTCQMTTLMSWPKGVWRKSKKLSVETDERGHLVDTQASIEDIQLEMPAESTNKGGASAELTTLGDVTGMQDFSPVENSERRGRPPKARPLLPMTHDEVLAIIDHDSEEAELAT
ncbi:hypothetical protein CFIMG_008474RA00001 [Ceratocystis fimbriata CBS 114723]|uniref:Integrase catalytic domain-containing protein n=1 Tax=Ceratocystis fimbriata CBS 114723 TaxID=1035309 RepID=A0A2C5X236_9PEZI|nr:hypothetical protein CFIMG_008474RA00001 [Ceratocystis fimbriata CBS 114723]